MFEETTPPNKENKHATTAQTPINIDNGKKHDAAAESGVMNTDEKAKNDPESRNVTKKMETKEKRRRRRNPLLQKKKRRRESDGGRRGRDRVER